MFELADGKATGLIGWIVAVFSLMAWSVHARFQRRTHADEMNRICDEKKALHEQLLNEKAPEARQVYDTINKLFDEAFFINSLGWAIYVVPPIAVLLLIRKVKRLVAHALIAPDAMFDSIAASTDTAAAMPV